MRRRSTPMAGTNLDRVESMKQHPPKVPDVTKRRRIPASAMRHVVDQIVEPRTAGAEQVLGGAAAFFSCAASFCASVRLMGVAGEEAS